MRYRGCIFGSTVNSINNTSTIETTSVDVYIMTVLIALLKVR